MKRKFRSLDKCKTQTHIDMANRRSVKTEANEPNAIKPVSSTSTASMKDLRSTGSADSDPDTLAASKFFKKFLNLKPAKQTLIRALLQTDDYGKLCQALEDFKVSITRETTSSGSNSDANSGQYEEEIKKRVRSRLSNYKEELDQKTGLRIHYWEKQGVSTGEPNYTDRMCSRFRPRLQCSGSGTKTSCSYSIDQRTEDEEEYFNTFKSFQFDHTYTQPYIHKSVEAAMKRCVEEAKKELTTLTVPSVAKWSLAYLKRYKYKPDIGKHPPKTPLQEKLDEIIRHWIDVDKLREDLYGERVVVRCANCHTKVNEEKDHLPYEEDRYFKNIGN